MIIEKGRDFKFGAMSDACEFLEAVVVLIHLVEEVEVIVIIETEGFKKLRVVFVHELLGGSQSIHLELGTKIPHKNICPHVPLASPDVVQDEAYHCSMPETNAQKKKTNTRSLLTMKLAIFQRR
ncbi:hypothetical protein AMTR_s00174p00011450 [Amborella trichopoda]|uniref:Uncharacterized protein n=1 Tax=Amborella trichopoda TaxID=13333 RepID=U5CWZ1_AMBTC|nr:hypothetical protein AMTR_s00174p00011450 [Amborella trichopoda]